MNIERLIGQYSFHNGMVKSFHLDIQNNYVEVNFFVKRKEGIHRTGPFQTEDLTLCTLKVRFEKIIEVSLFDKFPTQGYFLDFSTFNRRDDGIEVCFNVHDRSSSIYEKPNWIIKARKVTWREV